MKTFKLFILFFIFSYPCLSQTTYSTSHTSNVYTGQWTKIASVTITSRYQHSNSLLEFSGGSSSAYIGVCKLLFRVKQQAAYPSPPYIQLELIERNNSRISKEDFKAVITTLSGTEDSGNSTVDLYLRVTNTYEIIRFVPILVNNISPTFYSNQGFSTTLPAGTQVDCNYIDDYSRNGFFEGKVGIGVTSVTEALEVNGMIRAKEVKVEAAPWPDYVFTSQYNLPALERTDLYIKTHGHLPGIPTADQVAADGIKLGEMNAKLLEKIEELTLYLIEQNNQIKELRQKIEVLESN